MYIGLQVLTVLEWTASISMLFLKKSHCGKCFTIEYDRIYWRFLYIKVVSIFILVLQ